MKGCESTYAKEKLSTFWMAATAFPLIVMFVNGVLCSVSFPYQSMASTDAWPPSQLQLILCAIRRHLPCTMQREPPT